MTGERVVYKAQLWGQMYIHSCMLSKVAEIRKINRVLQPSDLMMEYLICVTIEINGEQRIAALSTLQCRLLNRMFGFHNKGQTMWKVCTCQQRTF